MSKIIASAVIRGAHKIVGQAEQKWQQAMGKWGANEPVGFPNTAYYLPVIYGMLGIPVQKLGDMEQILNRCKGLLPPPVREEHPLPYLGPALDAGMATFFAEELVEGIRYLEEPEFYTKMEEKCKAIVKPLRNAIHEYNVKAQINHIASMFQIFFTETPVYDYTTSKMADTIMFMKYHAKLLKRGVFVPPSQFETCFLSSELTQLDIQNTIAVITTILREQGKREVKR